MRGVAKRIFEEKGIQLDPIQYVAYKIICSSFLLNLINEAWEKRLTMFSSTFSDESNEENATGQEEKDHIVKRLQDLGAKVQLLMFITGPAGSGKSTALEVAQHFCFEFCKTIGEHWDDTTFLFSAMTGAAASLFGGVTTHSAAFLNYNDLKNITPELMRTWKNVKMFIIDEISFASDPDMNKMNEILNNIRKFITPSSPLITPSMVFGGFSIIFSGDFHQLPPVKLDSSKYLYNGTSMWENAINVAVVLKNSHRFKDDPEYGRMLLRIWQGELSDEDRLKINNRMVGLNGVELPPINSDSDIAYSCPINYDRNLIQTELFQKHIQNFPSVSSDEPPPEHTVVIEAHISKTTRKRKRKRNNNNRNSSNNNSETPSYSYIPVNNVIRHRIYTRCGDADVLCQTKHIDPALKFYTGAHFMVNDNDNIADGRGNGTLCRAVSVKLKRDGMMTWKNYDGKKVYTVNIFDTEYMICEHFPPTIAQQKLQKQILDLKDNLESQDNSEEVRSQIAELEKKLHKISLSRQFKLYPKEYRCIIKDKNVLTMDDELFRGKGLPGMAKKPCCVKMHQYPINLNDATTGHKLQGMTKNTLIIRDWSYKPGWVYTNLSRVRTFNGLFTNKFLQAKPGAVSPSRELRSFEERMKLKIPQEILDLYSQAESIGDD